MRVLITIHPSYLLRIENDDDKTGRGGGLKKVAAIPTVCFGSAHQSCPIHHSSHHP
jgi:hypothetical protein